MHLFWLIFLPAAGYQCLAIFAGLFHLWKRQAARSPESDFRPGISILKALRGLDPGIQEAFESHVHQDYPSYELLFGVGEFDDPAAREVERLQARFPNAPIYLVTGCADVPNRKVGVLMELASRARYPVWLVNDSDIKVTPRYLAEVVAPLASSGVGVVTCPYRPRAYSAAAAWEALGIATDFMPSALVAPLVGVREFGLGSTLAFRADDFQRAGGFRAIADYLADDYQLAKRITTSGKKALLSTYTVETSLGDPSWRGVWEHQQRWARTIRLSKGAGYAGLPITHAGVWALIACLSGAWPVAAALAVLRILSGLITAGWVLRSPALGASAVLGPVWDFYALAVWVSSYASREVRWRDRRLRVDSEGRIERQVP